MAQKRQELKSITFDEADGLKIDENNNLYWKGKKLQTQTKIKLDNWVNVSVIAAGIGTVGSFILDLIKFFR